ncbi:MAG: DUF3189 family protein [Planifilum sp.]
MRIFYYCYGSAHSSVVAAAIHLGKLPTRRVPTISEICSLPDFDRSSDQCLGMVYYKGKDEWGNPVYTVGLGSRPAVACRTLQSMIHLMGNPEDFRFYNALDCLKMMGKVGGAISRRYGFPTLGRPLAAWGVKRSYSLLVALVERVKREVRVASEEHSG